MAKKNFRKVPKYIIDRIKTFDQDDVVVACVKRLKKVEVERYKHLGLTLSGGNLRIPDSFLPDPKMGKFSRANVEGREKQRTDLPKVTKSYEIEVPNWGDWSNGSHTITWDRQVYLVEFYPPKGVELSIALIEEGEDVCIVRFSIDQVINRRTPNFEQELFYNLNILQENVGAAEVFESTMSLEEYARSVQVEWEIFPPGTAADALEKIVPKQRGITEEKVNEIRSKIELILSLEPEAIITGTGGFLRYFGARFGEDLVVFENVHYGNAIYIMYESWEELSKKSRTELLSGRRDSFDRIEHRDGWEDRLVGKVKTYKMKNRRL